ncbi:hypothetical protein SAMN05444141_101699 [Pseudovibrio denitrificans]|uniref:Uncharacterized protein n=1 Tax=Pseudovibrio denitrificans TaxID=258256 RepID=A0A1I6Y804_9HYPH|nr:hypothetical protein SAMN05444141_101699 [Pseudovibrio denitrificans]
MRNQAVLSKMKAISYHFAKLAIWTDQIGKTKPPGEQTPGGSETDS